MKSLKARVLALAAAGAAALGAAAFAGPAAQAQPYPPAEIGRVITLAALSRTDDHATLPHAAPYSIELVAGVYLWEVKLGDRPVSTEIYLAHDVYNWRCYLSGLGKLYPEVNYKGNCLLDPATPNAGNATLPRDGSAVRYAVQGDASWTSKLTWLRPRL